MHKKQPHILLLIIACSLCLPAMLQAAVTRTVDVTDCTAVVTVAVTPDAGTSAWAYEEHLYGLVPSAISESGIYLEDKGVIRWGTFLDNTARTLSYSIAAREGNYSLLGKESQDGDLVAMNSTAVAFTCAPPPIETVGAPTFDPAVGADVPVTVTITSATADSDIYYTTDGSIPTPSAALYTDPVVISQPAMLQAVAVKAGMADSAITRASYSLPYVPPALTLERTIAGTICRPVVSIEVAPDAGTSAYAVAESLPDGLVPENISDNGLWIAETATIHWGTFTDETARTLTYELTGPDATYDLAGNGSFDGRSQAIGGDAQTEIDCIPDQAATPALDPPSGSRVPLNVSMTTTTPEAEIRYTLDGSEPDESSALYASPVVVDATATVQAKTFKAGLAPSDTARADYLPAKRPLAIIVSGSGPDGGNALWPATVHVSNYAYHALLYQGYAKGDIQFLGHDLTIDADGNGQPDDVDATATATNLEQAITTWAQDATDLLIYLTGHGGDGTFLIGPGETLPASDLAAWLNTLQTSLPGRVILVYDACQAGTFIPELVPPADVSRVLITSADNEPAMFLEGGVLSFSYQFWVAAFLNGRVYDAFLAGKNLMGGDQRPQLDVNGNGIANEKTDRTLAGDLTIGRGMVAAAAFPEILSYPGEQILGSGTDADIWAENISTLDPLSRVWAVIIPPDYHPADVSDPILDLPSQDLTDPDGDGRYECNYTGFTLNGTYRILIYAQDIQGLVSEPVETTVVQTAGEIPANNVPTALTGSIETDEDTAVSGTLAATDPDSDPLTYIVLDDGTIGTVSITDVHTGAFVYQPHGNENGADTFTFKVNDGFIDSNTATVTVTVNGVEDPPQALNMAISVEQNDSVAGTLTAEDGDADPLTFTLDQLPGHGTVVLHDAATGSFTYTPTAGYFGTDTFTFTADDGKAVSPPGTITIDVDRGYNDPPTATGTTASGDEDTIITGVLAAADPNFDPVTFSLVAAPLKGTVALTDAAAGAFTYSPHPNANGDDTFTYKVSDGLAESDPATCTVTIAPINDPPVSQDSYLSVTSPAGATGSLAATDIENDPLTFSLATNGQRGQAVLTDAATGAFSYTPDTTENGMDSFTFTASDGLDTSAPATITVSIIQPQADLSRTVGGDGCVLEVTLTVTPVATVNAYAVEEPLTAGVAPSEISDNGTWDETERKIRWGTFLDSAPRGLTYRLSGADGNYTLAGRGSFDGWGQATAGDSEAIIACGAQRAAAPVFNPAGGTRVPVDVEMTSATEGADIRYTTDGSTPTAGSDLYTAPLHFDQPVTLKARAYKDGLYASLVGSVAYLPNKPRKAIIVTGGSTTDALWPATALAGEYAYKALLYQGYAKEDIKFFSPLTEVDVDGNGAFDDIAGLAQSTLLEDAIVSWALDAENLVLFLVDHGGDGTFQVNPGDILAAADLDTWLDTLQQTMPGRVVVVYDACRAGTFVSHLVPPEGKQRIVITSAADENAWFLWEGRLSFSYQFWASMFGNGNIYDAFVSGSSMMSDFQDALLDADGDGVGDEADDLLAVADIVIGRGSAAAGLPPQIGWVSPDRSIGLQTNATVQAGNITTANGIERVWAIIVPPDYTPASADDPITSMTTIDLIDPDGDGVFAADYDGFTLEGTYNITIYVQDSGGLISEPQQTSITRGIVKGDLNADGAADMTDLILALQLMSGMQSADMRPDYPVSGADVDGDLKPGIAEVVYLLQKMAGLRVGP